MDQNHSSAADILCERRYCTVSTCSLDSQPWITPVGYAIDEDLNLYWLSECTAKHSSLLEANPRASVVVFDSTAPAGVGNAVYMSGSVQISPESRMDRALTVLREKAGPALHLFTSDLRRAIPDLIGLSAPDADWPDWQPSRHGIELAVEAGAAGLLEVRRELRGTDDNRKMAALMVMDTIIADLPLEEAEKLVRTVKPYTLPPHSPGAVSYTHLTLPTT